MTNKSKSSDPGVGFPMWLTMIIVLVVGFGASSALTVLLIVDALKPVNVQVTSLRFGDCTAEIVKSFGSAVDADYIAVHRRCQDAIDTCLFRSARYDTVISATKADNRRMRLVLSRNSLALRGNGHSDTVFILVR